MKIILVLSLIISTAAFAEACPSHVLPSEYELSEQLISFTTKLNIESDKGDHGYVREKIISLSTSFEYFNEKDQLVAKASKVIFSWGGRVEVFDCNGSKIGEIKEEIIKSLFSFSTIYTILGKNGEVVASSEKLEFASTDFTIKNPSGEVIARIYRPWLSLTDKWKVSVLNPNLDSRVLVMIGAFKTSNDNERAEKTRKSSSKK